jgi:hypothetical protein
MNTEQKAITAKRLMDDEGLQMAFAEIRDTATAVFLNTASTQEDREQAHQDVRAIEAIRNRFGLWSDAKKIADKRKRSAP